MIPYTDAQNEELVVNSGSILGENRKGGSKKHEKEKGNMEIWGGPKSET